MTKNQHLNALPLDEIHEVLDEDRWNDGYTGRNLRRREGEDVPKVTTKAKLNMSRHTQAKMLEKKVFNAMSALMDATDGNMNADQNREYLQMQQFFDQLHTVREENFIDRTGVVAPDGSTSRQDYAEGKPLADGQTFTGFARAHGHLQNDGHGTIGEDDLSLSKYLRGAMTGDWADADAERLQFRAALSGGTGGAGGFLLPTILTTGIIDLARSKARVIEAGATIVPMANRTVDVPKWTGDPDPSWREELDPVAEDDATIDKLTLEAKTLGVVTKVSRELVEDTDIDAELMHAFAESFALKIDQASLYGSGVDPEPEGVKTSSDVLKTSMGTNGATPTNWNPLVDSVSRLRDENEEPTAQILANRTLSTLAKLTGSDGQYLGAPSYLDGIPRLATNQVSRNLVVGTSGATTSDVFTGDWSQLYIGVRISLVVDVLKERYMVDSGSYGFLGWWRGDIQVARPKAFDVVTGVKP